MSDCEGNWTPDYLEVWEEEECVIDGLLEIFLDACKKDKIKSSYPLGAGISRLEMFIEDCIEDCCSVNEFRVKEWKKALKDAALGDN